MRADNVDTEQIDSSTPDGEVILKKGQEWVNPNPNRQERRARTFRAKRQMGRAMHGAVLADHQIMKRMRGKTQGITGNPHKRAHELQAWVEIENAYRGHV